MAVNGDTVVRWIDSKGSCPLPGLGFASALAKLRGQLARFVELFGPGLVVWRGGFAAAATEGTALAAARPAHAPVSRAARRPRRADTARLGL